MIHCTSSLLALALCGMTLGGCPKNSSTNGDNGGSSLARSEKSGGSAEHQSLAGDESPASGENVSLPAAPTVTGKNQSKGHPRLWIRQADLPRLRRLARGDNPYYQALSRLVQSAKSEMDKGEVPAKDNGSVAWVATPVEMYAQLFAFISLISPNAEEREDYAKRARRLLMVGIDHAVKGMAEGQPFRDRAFALSDRSRWWGQGWPLTVDWIYDKLSTSDKKKIRQVFLRWAAENRRAQTTNHNHPEPLGKTNDPVLIKDKRLVRWSANNYYTAHMRNIGLMSLALDQADDPGEELRGLLAEATGAWLYVVDRLLRKECPGGAGPEGFEYSPQAFGYVTQFLLALYTAGEADPRKWGGQVVLQQNRFWNDMLPAFAQMMSPQTAEHDWRGPIYLPAWYGDGQNYLAEDPIELFGPVAIYDRLRGNRARLDAIRWFQLTYPPGGPKRLLDRIGKAQNFRDAMLYFMVFAPGEAPPRDPRASYPLNYFLPGLGQLYSRTSWRTDATWFRYIFGWRGIDHQHGETNHFGFYRKGEWLTKKTVGYGNLSASSDNMNTLTIKNDPPAHNSSSDYRHLLGERGSQWLFAIEDPRLLALSMKPSFVYALGDATNHYNSNYERSHDVVHASRSIIWLKPDHIVIYDRVETGKANRFKRFWLQLPAEPKIEGRRVSVKTPKGQTLHLHSLLPQQATLSAQPLADSPANHEPMKRRLRVEASGHPKRTRFLHVLQGADSGRSPDRAVLVPVSGNPAFVAAAVKELVVLFPESIPRRGSVALEYTAPSQTTRHLITGLSAGSGYAVSRSAAAGGMRVQIKSGGEYKADEGGVLDIGK
jgi:hypothetical protein